MRVDLKQVEQIVADDVLVENSRIKKEMLKVV